MPMIFLAKLGVGVLGTAVVAGAALASEGFIHVRVHEKNPGGKNISLIVPAAVVPVALHFVPRKDLDQAPRDLQEVLPIIDAAVPELEKCQDGVLVEVVDPGEHVIISKAGGSVVIDVNDHDDTVHVSVPLRAVRSSLHQIADANGMRD
jgi:hypothetical protein